MKKLSNGILKALLFGVSPFVAIVACTSPPTVIDVGPAVNSPVNVTFLVSEDDALHTFQGIKECEHFEPPPLQDPDGGKFSIKAHVIHRGTKGVIVRFDCGNGTFGPPRQISYGTFVNTGCATNNGRPIMARISGQ